MICDLELNRRPGSLPGLEIRLAFSSLLGYRWNKRCTNSSTDINFKVAIYAVWSKKSRNLLNSVESLNRFVKNSAKKFGRIFEYDEHVNLC